MQWSFHNPMFTYAHALDHAASSSVNWLESQYIGEFQVAWGLSRCK